MKKLVLLGLLGMLSTSVMAEKLAVIKTSGMFIKDTLEVLAFDDPTIKGATCYVTAPKRSLSFEDQTNGSISCRKVGKISGSLTSKKRIFKQSKNLFFKNMYVDRIYDKKRNVLIYVSYTSKLSGDNASNSISVISLN